MFVCFTFEAKPGKEAEFERVLNDPGAGGRTARLMGATRNTLFLKGGRMVRVLEFPDGVKPVPLAEIAKRDRGVEAFLRALGPLIRDGYDLDDPGTLEAFNQRALVPVAYDVRS